MSCRILLFLKRQILKCSQGDTRDYPAKMEQIEIINVRDPMSFLNSFTDNVRLYPDKVALEFIDPPLQRVTYAELDRLVQQTKGYLRSLGLQPGDRVALQLSKSLEFILLHLAAIRLGCITLPLNLAYPPDELKYFLEDSGTNLFFVLETSKEKIESILPGLPDLQQCIFLNPSDPEQF